MAFESLDLILDHVGPRLNGQFVPDELKDAYRLMREATEIVVGQEYNATENTLIGTFLKRTIMGIPSIKRYTLDDQIDKFTQAQAKLSEAEKARITFQFSPQAKAFEAQTDFNFVSQVLKLYAGTEISIRRKDPAGVLNGLNGLIDLVGSRSPNTPLIDYLKAQKAEFYIGIGLPDEAQRIAKEEMRPDAAYGLTGRLNAMVSRAVGEPEAEGMKSIAGAYMANPNDPDVIKELQEQLRVSSLTEPSSNYRLDATIPKGAVEMYQSGMLRLQRNPMMAARALESAKDLLGYTDGTGAITGKFTGEPVTNKVARALAARIEIGLGMAEQYISGVDAALEHGFAAYEIMPIPQGVQFLDEMLGNKLESLEQQTNNRLRKDPLRPDQYFGPERRGLLQLESGYQAPNQYQLPAPKGPPRNEGGAIIMPQGTPPANSGNGPAV